MYKEQFLEDLGQLVGKRLYEIDLKVEGLKTKCQQSTEYEDIEEYVNEIKKLEEIRDRAGKFEMRIRDGKYHEIEYLLKELDK